MFHGVSFRSDLVEGSRSERRVARSTGSAVDHEPVERAEQAIGLAGHMRQADETVLIDGPGANGRCTTSYPGVTGPDELSPCQWDMKTIAAVANTLLNAELTKVLNTAEMKERFAKQGTEVRTDTPESLGRWLGTEQAKWAKVVKESGAKFE